MFLTMDGIIPPSNLALRYQLCDMFTRHIPALSHIDACDTIGFISNQGETNEVSRKNLLSITVSNLIRDLSLSHVQCD